MREIDSSRRGTPHIHLSSDIVKKAFNQNIVDTKHSTESAYNDDKSDRENSLKWVLKQIYYEKCAFCESYIKNEVGDIEHFRPKNSNIKQAKKCDKTYSYYWLAFSWDNLLPACSRCNGKKSNCFDIVGTRVSYNVSDSLESLHNKTIEYNNLEKPKLLHPEYDIFEQDIRFNDKGKICSDNERVQYTVIICDLNRDNLKKSRKDIIDDFINKLNSNLLSFCSHYKDGNFDTCLEFFKGTIIEFCEKSDKKYEYSLIRQYIKDNFQDFLNKAKIDSQDENFSKNIIQVAFESFST